jgi:hypothetical protein
MGKRTKRVDQRMLEFFGRELGRWVEDACDGNQTAAGKLLGVTQGHISAMIAGTRGPGLPTLIALSDKTGKSIDALLGRGRREPTRAVPLLPPGPPSSAVPPAAMAELQSMLERGRDIIQQLESELPPKPKKKGSPSDAPPPRYRRRP